MINMLKPSITAKKKLFFKMIYKVKAKIVEEKVGEFFKKLSDGTIANQRPDGGEIVKSMKSAVITKSGHAEWYQLCYCTTPLWHERKTQYDFYFTDIETETVEDYGEVIGKSLWTYLESSK